jgi:hypothetical protein
VRLATGQWGKKRGDGLDWGEKGSYIAIGDRDGLGFNCIDIGRLLDIWWAGRQWKARKGKRERWRYSERKDERQMCERARCHTRDSDESGPQARR